MPPSLFVFAFFFLVFFVSSPTQPLLYLSHPSLSLSIFHSLPSTLLLFLFLLYFSLSFLPNSRSFSPLLPPPLSLFISVLTSSQSALTRRSRKITSPLFKFSSALLLPRKSNIAWDTHRKKKPRTHESVRGERKERGERRTQSTQREKGR